MATMNITVEVRVSWWVRLYIATLAAVCRLTGTEPDIDKVYRTVRRGIRLVKE